MKQIVKIETIMARLQRAATIIITHLQHVQPSGTGVPRQKVVILLLTVAEVLWLQGAVKTQKHCALLQQEHGTPLSTVPVVISATWSALTEGNATGPPVHANVILAGLVTIVLYRPCMVLGKLPKLNNRFHSCLGLRGRHALLAEFEVLACEREETLREGGLFW